MKDLSCFLDVIPSARNTRTSLKSLLFTQRFFFFLIYIRVLIIVLHRWDFLLRFSCFQRESFRVYYWYKYLLSVFWQMKHYTFETSNDSDLDKKGNLLALKANIQLWEFVQFLSTGEIIEEIKEGKVSCKCVGSPLSYSLFSTLTPPHSPAHSPPHSLIPSLTHSLTHSLTPSLTHPLAHSPPHSLTPDGLTEIKVRVFGSRLKLVQA